MMMNKHKFTLERTVADVIIATVLALSVLVFITQEANAVSVGTKNNFKQEQKNTCSSFADCINSGTVTFGLDGGHTRP